MPAPSDSIEPMPLPGNGRNERGATLIELIVTIILLGLMAAMLSVVAFSLFGQGGASPNTNVQAENIAGSVEENFLAAAFPGGCSVQGVSMPSGFTASASSSSASALNIPAGRIVSCVVSVYRDGNIATTLGAYKTEYQTVAGNAGNGGNGGNGGGNGNAGNGGNSNGNGG